MAGDREFLVEAIGFMRRVHNPFAHDLVRDEIRCPICKFIKRAERYLERRGASETK